MQCLIQSHEKNDPVARFFGIKSTTLLILSRYGLSFSTLLEETDCGESQKKSQENPYYKINIKTHEWLQRLHFGFASR